MTIGDIVQTTTPILWGTNDYHVGSIGEIVAFTDNVFLKMFPYVVRMKDGRQVYFKANELELVNPDKGLYEVVYAKLP